jgi:hypothetical protein
MIPNKDCMYCSEIEESCKKCHKYIRTDRELMMKECPILTYPLDSIFPNTDDRPYWTWNKRPNEIDEVEIIIEC